LKLWSNHPLTTIELCLRRSVHHSVILIVKVRKGITGFNSSFNAVFFEPQRDTEEKIHGEPRRNSSVFLCVKLCGSLWLKNLS